MLKKKSISNKLKMPIKGLPLMAIVGASMLPLPNLARQFLILVVLLWVQVFFVYECFLIDR